MIHRPLLIHLGKKKKVLIEHSMIVSHLFALDTENTRMRGQYIALS